ncbi:MAG: Ig-like domain-containing protein [Clostridiaceae bacterium]|nr:Ig-like domain-containing protein [Eubacteriales bacterium]
MKRVFLTLLAATLFFGCFLSAHAEAQPASSVKLNRTKAAFTLKKGDAFPCFALEAKTTPAGAVLTWSSSDETVATVDENGRVACVGFGVAVIAASAGEGGKSASCAVTVKKAAVSGVRLDYMDYVFSIAAGESPGASFKLSAKAEPENAYDASLRFYSSDETVATVDESGLVTSVGFGTAVITASSNDGSGQKASCTVRVEKIAVRSVSLSLTKKAVVVEKGGDFGEPFQIGASVGPENAFDTALVWKSSNEAVATVDENGLVTCVGFGEAIITASAADGGGTGARCAVKVSCVEVKKISLSTSRLSLEGGGTYLLAASVSPADATYGEVEWRSSDPAVVRVEAGVVTACGKGAAKVYAMAADGSGVMAVCAVKVLSNAPPQDDDAKDTIFSGNVYDLYSQLGSGEEQVLRAYYNTLGSDRPARILKKALEYAGVGYVYADCSKLAMLAYRAGGYTIPRVSDKQAYALRGRIIDRSKLRPGDLIFFQKLPGELCSCGEVCRRYQQIHHVGIYFGYVNGQHYIIDASSVLGKTVIRRWDGSDNFAEMLYAFSARR